MLPSTRQLVNSLAVVVLVLGFLGQAVTAAKSAGCGKATEISSGTYSVTVNGKNRQYIIRVPSGYDSSRGYKLIFGLHWLSGTMTDVATGQTVQRDVWVSCAISSPCHLEGKILVQD